MLSCNIIGLIRLSGNGPRSARFRAHLGPLRTILVGTGLVTRVHVYRETARIVTDGEEGPERVPVYTIIVSRCLDEHLQPELR